MIAPTIKGWCPGAYRPMMSGDGLIVRIRPKAARLTIHQVIEVCTLAQKYGNGLIELTSRSNLQLRGIGQDSHEALLQELARLGVLDCDPVTENRRNILVTPFWQTDDLCIRLHSVLLKALADLPDLPGKVGFGIDTGNSPVLACNSADFRFERAQQGLILRADGVSMGRTICEATAIDALIEMVDWFNQHRTTKRRRMAQVTAVTPLPKAWRTTAPLPPALPPQPGLHALGAIIGVPFGQAQAQELLQAVKISGANALRITPWRLLLLEGGALPPNGPFITTPNNPLMTIDACPGRPLCSQAQIETRAFARHLAGHGIRDVHISGCSKGCARTRMATRTLVGRNGVFDLVKRGYAWDVPDQTGLHPDDLLAEARERQ